MSDIYSGDTNQSYIRTFKFGFLEYPFLPNSEARFFYPVNSHVQIIFRSLRHQEKPIRLLVTGQKGSGRGMIAKVLFHHLSKQKEVLPVIYRPLHFDSETLNLSFLMKQMGFETKGSYEKNQEMLQEHLLHQAADNRKPVFLILIQDKPYLPQKFDALIRNILSLFYQAKPIFHIVWIVPDLFTKEKSVLAQKMTDYEELPLFSYDEMVQMIIFRCLVAGRTAPLFTKKAFRQIYHFTSGLPSQVIELCNGTLQEAEQSRKNLCGEEEVISAWNRRFQNY